MRKIREILRLAWSCGQSRKAIAVACSVGKTTVTDTIARANAAGLRWDTLSQFDDEALEGLLYPPVDHPARRKTPLPDWNALHNELATHKNLTLMLLWQEYKEQTSDGFQYSHFCELYRLINVNYYFRPATIKIPVFCPEGLRVVSRRFCTGREPSAPKWSARRGEPPCVKPVYDSGCACVF